MDCRRSAKEGTPPAAYVNFPFRESLIADSKQALNANGAQTSCNKRAKSPSQTTRVDAGEGLGSSAFYYCPTSILRGFASSDLGRVTVRTPSL
jgi:hypothetical protein